MRKTSAHATSTPQTSLTVSSPYTFLSFASPQSCKEVRPIYISRQLQLFFRLETSPHNFRVMPSHKEPHWGLDGTYELHIGRVFLQRKMKIKIKLFVYEQNHENPNFESQTSD